MATALYRRYRPESFAEVIGQDHVTTPLGRALRAGRVGHAYLFSGPRGCGKTTSARILARCLNCEQGPTDTPCGTCDSCRDLARGGAGSLDVVEIDAASHGGVDDARELRERASFAPVRDRYKVFIIDEAHMVTSAGFNALLKLVEEPPEHVKFVFATTEPDKVIGTIRSRTHHYPFRLIPPQVLGPYLDEVCAAEGVQVGDGVMPLVVRAGGGSARDSMSVLDQLMAGAGEDGLDFPTAIALLGFTDTALLDQAVTAVAERDAASLYSAVEHVLATGHEPRRFVEDLLERMRDLIVLAAVPDRGADLLPQVPADELERMRGQASQFAPADLSLCGDLVHETLSTMSGATSPRLHLELLAARLVLRDERATLSAADGPGAQAAAAADGTPTGRGGQDRSGAPAQAGGGGREEARRIAQERAEAARQARGGGRQAPGQAGQAAADGQAGQGAAARQAGPAAPTTQDAPAAPAEHAAPDASRAPASAASTDSAAGGAPGASAGSSPAQGGGPQDRAQEQDGRNAPAQGPASRRDEAAASWGAIAAAGAGRDGAPQGDVRNPAPGGPGQAPQPQGDSPTQGGGRPAGEASQPQGDVPQGQAGAPQSQSAAAAPGGGLDAEEVRGHWSAILDELQQIRRPSWALISQNAHVNGARGTTLVLGFRTEGLVSAFHRGTAAENLADAVRRIMHTDITVEAVVGEDPGPGAGPGGGGPGPGGSGGGGPAAGGPGAPGSGGPGAAGPGGPGPGGPGAGGPAGSGPGGGGASGPGPAAPGGGTTPGAPGGSSPAGRDVPRQSGAPWGDAASAMTPRSASSATEPARTEGAAGDSAAPAGAEREEQTVSVGQRASERAMAAAARAARSAPAGPSYAPPDDFPPEPDDPYPPDPEEYGAPAPQDGGRPAPQAPGRPAPRNEDPAQSPGRRWSDAIPGRSTDSSGADGGTAPATRPDDAAAPGTDDAAPHEGAAAAPNGPATGGAPLEVEDEGRDSLPKEEPRTFGQNALRRALAEGRVVRSLPAAHPQQSGAAPAGDEGAGPDEFQAAESGSSTPFSPGSPVSPASPSPVGSGHPAAPAVAPGSAGAPSSTGVPDPVGDSVPADAATGPEESATARAAASWGAAATVAGTVPGRQGAAPSAPEAPRSGAALVREAAMASRAAGQGLRSARREPDAAPEADVDPTGGATRDDADAVVATRNGREVIEKMLGGKVLEVVDESQRP